MNRPSVPPPSVPQASPYAFGYPPPPFAQVSVPPQVTPPASPAPQYKLVELASGFDPRATAALILGVISLVTGAFAGVPAFILGSQARRDEERIRLLYPHVPRRVAGVALAGMICGAVGTLLGVALIAGTGGYWFAQHQLREAHPAYALHTPAASSSPRAAEHEPTSFGAIRVVDLAEDDALPFRDRLKAELKTAHDAGHPVLVETTASFCRSCDEINGALHQDPLQRALAGATLVRVDVETFEEELRAAGMWQDTVPWFYRLDSNMRPTDAISADEWDENTAENIAKVIGPFAHGTLPKRRTPSPLTTSL
jgi:hypothetical protein